MTAMDDLAAAVATIATPAGPVTVRRGWWCPICQRVIRAVDLAPNSTKGASLAFYHELGDGPELHGVQAVVIEEHAYGPPSGKSWHIFDVDSTEGAALIAAAELADATGTPR